MKKVRIIAIIAAIITAVLVYIFLMNVNKSTEVDMTSVVAAKYNIDKDTIITEEMLTFIDIPAESAHAYAAHRVSEVVGKISSGPIVQNEQIITTKLVEPGENYDSLAYAIEEGQRAMTIAVDEVSGVACLLRPQDYVDILVIITIEEIVETENEEEDTIGGEYSGDFSQSLVTRTTYSAELLQHIKILAVGRHLDSKGIDDETSYNTVTLSVTPEQAVKLNLAVSDGSIRLILRSPLNSEITEQDIITIEDLLEDTEK